MITDPHSTLTFAACISLCSQICRTIYPGLTPTSTHKTHPHNNISAVCVDACHKSSFLKLCLRQKSMAVMGQECREPSAAEAAPPQTRAQQASQAKTSTPLGHWVHKQHPPKLLHLHIFLALSMCNFADLLGTGSIWKPHLRVLKHQLEGGNGEVIQMQLKNNLCFLTACISLGYPRESFWPCSHSIALTLFLGR